MRHILERERGRKFQGDRLTVQKVNYFETDDNDEFRITCADGRQQGIFKTWAVPIIPFLEAGREEILREALVTPDGLNRGQAKQILERWGQEMAKHPHALAQSLEYWQSITSVNDRRLHEIFESTPLPADREERIAELYWRLVMAFHAAAPFYHLEALVAQTHFTQENPLNYLGADNNQEASTGHNLDLVAMFLPAGLEPLVKAEKGNWHNLNWPEIHKMFARLPELSPERRIILRLSSLTGADPIDVIFAANALEWIPADVGGKHGDLAYKEAQRQLEKLTQQKHSDQLDIATTYRRMNSLIRFLNWFPLKRSEENFQGRGWRYASVCDTTNLLFAEIKKGGVLTPEYEKVFRATISKQLENLDATSARGRWILDAVRSGKVNESVLSVIQARQKTSITTINCRLMELQQQEAFLPLKQAREVALVGKKAFGLWLARQVIGPSYSLPGQVLNGEIINQLFWQQSNLSRLIRELANAPNLQQQQAVARKIRREIKHIEMPKELLSQLKDIFPHTNSFAVRSSSLDEDTGFFTAAGIYESVIHVSPQAINEAIQKVLISFFSDKAIGYRYRFGLPHTPKMAIIFQPYLNNSGGVIFFRGKRNWHITLGKSAAAITAAEKDSPFLEIDAKSRNFSPPQQLNLLLKLAEKMQVVLGPVDIEFSLRGNKPVILQARSLIIPTAEKSLPLPQERQSSKKSALIAMVDGIQLKGIRIEDGPVRKVFVEPSLDVSIFQGRLMRWLVINHARIDELILPAPIPLTSHLANLCAGLGIKIRFDEMF